MAIKLINKRPAEGMTLEPMTYEQKNQHVKKLLKCGIYRLFESAIFWMFIGFIISTISLTYVLTDTFKQIDKIMVCK